MCDDDIIAKRAILVFTNLVMLLPLYRILNESFRLAKKQDPIMFNNKTCCSKFCDTIIIFFQKFVIEFSVYITTMIVSMLYHACDGVDDCTTYCISDWENLYHLDFIFSYLTLCTLIVSLIDRRTSLFKFLTNGLFAIVISVYITQYKDAEESLYNNIFYASIAIGNILIIIGKLIYLKYYKLLSHEFLFHFDCIDFISGVICLALGLFFKVMSDSHYYYLFHSLWHIFIMFAIMFCIEIYDKSVSFLCCKIKNNNCPQCD